MDAIDAAPSADIDCSSLAIVSALTRAPGPPAGLAGIAFALTSSGCHAGISASGPVRDCIYGQFRAL
jgi:hypothetical protein